MKIFILLILFSSYIFLLILHSYYRKGLQLTVNFFLFAFLLIFTNGGVCCLSFLNLPTHNKSIIIGSLASTLLNLPIFYFSWYIIEEVMRWVNSLKKRSSLFLIVLLSGLVAVCLNLLFSAIIKEMAFPRKVFYLFAHFLTAFILINCSKYKHKKWKTIFFLIPLVYIWVVRFSGYQGFILSVERCSFLVLLLIISSFNCLVPDYPKTNFISSYRRSDNKLIYFIPYIVLISALLLLVLLRH